MAIETGLQAARVTPRRLWFGLAAAAAAWALLGLLDIVITWRACVHQEEFANAVAHPAVKIVYILVAAVLFSVVVASGFTSYRNWRAVSQGRRFFDTTGTDRQEFMAMLGVFVSVTLGMGVLWLAIPPLVIELCVRAR